MIFQPEAWRPIRDLHQIPEKVRRDRLLMLPVMLAVVLGFKFPWFDQFTEEGKYFVTRQWEKTAYEVTQVLSSGSHHWDEIIQMGKYRSNPCKHSVRMVAPLAMLSNKCPEPQTCISSASL